MTPERWEPQGTAGATTTATASGAWLLASGLLSPTDTTQALEATLSPASFLPLPGMFSPLSHLPCRRVTLLPRLLLHGSHWTKGLASGTFATTSRQGTAPPISPERKLRHREGKWAQSCPQPQGSALAPPGQHGVPQTQGFSCDDSNSPRSPCTHTGPCPSRLPLGLLHVLLWLKHSLRPWHHPLHPRLFLRAQSTHLPGQPRGIEIPSKHRGPSPPCPGPSRPPAAGTLRLLPAGPPRASLSTSGTGTRNQSSQAEQDRDDAHGDLSQSLASPDHQE